MVQSIQSRPTRLESARLEGARLEAVPRLRDLQVARPDPERVAVLLNRNARRVNDRVARDVEALVGRENLYYSRSLEEAEAFSREIVQRGYGTVVCGGGDGTLMRTYNLIQRYVDEANAWRIERYRRFGEIQQLLDLPRFAFLGLGTGNSMRPVVGGTQTPVSDLHKMLKSTTAHTHSVPLIELGDERCLFAGMGYDSAILNDYNWLKHHTHNRFLKPFMHTVMGYFAAIFSRTLPRILWGADHGMEVRVVTQDTAYYLDPRRGDAAVEVPAGTTLFEGPASMVGAATIPYYGYGLKVYPFASVMPNMMQLRIANINPVKVLAHLPSVWNGSFRDAEHIFDFAVRDIKIELARPYPFQHSGDAQGLRDRLQMRVAPAPLRLVDFHRPLPVNS